MIMRSIVNLNFIFLLSLCGCYRLLPNLQPITPPKAQVKAEKSACDKMWSAIEDDSNLQTTSAKTIHVERQFQRIIRKDCIGNITSDKIETIKSPTFSVDITAASDKPFKSVLVYNQPSCDHELTSMPIENPIIFGALNKVTGDGKNKIQIKGDLAEAWFTFRFREGENQLYVRYFYDCSPSDFEGNRNSVTGKSTCPASSDYQTVIYPISIIYSEKTLTDSKTIEPSQQSCK